ncbi:molybdopterin-dependent oxidoreductase [Croceicoccus sp. F390]|uniref:Molybdopterin-dependent oxidoreductase n=1 Tax=Croceicoccus esteveae TaxID=3075597 RepID=A0ABU2ZFA8_9SPHN|nr:molybdopterin-dependent oxidoreductase [Croceicoccus sp. F390]MDT0574984.1 molybdopterin-dependent oxidoreductase [Croceicoccus sp. F390]
MTTGRRRFLLRAGAGAGAALVLSGCQKVLETAPVRDLALSLDDFTMRSQRLVTDRKALAREYAPSQMSPFFRPNGSRTVDRPEYQRMLANGFADFRLTVGGLVQRSLQLSLAELMELPARTQITRHDCVEGWSAIGQWTGTPLKLLMDIAGVDRSKARYLLFQCADEIGGVPYYETIDLVEALHPQTILAWRMNGQMLPEMYGAPLRLRVERQLGYKHAKFVMGIEAIADYRTIRGGKGGYWEDSADYEWWAGI